MNDERVAREIDIEPIREALINCGFFFVVFLTAVALNGVFPDLTALTCALVLLPYLIILGFILYRRSAGKPWFPVGSAGEALSRYVLIAAILALTAFIFAYNNGLVRPLTLAGALNHFGKIVEEPLAEEFVFRGALLTSLNRTRLSAISVPHVQMSVIVGAVIYSTMHCLIFLASGIAFSDALISSVTALIAGVVFGVIYLRTQDIWYGVFLSMLFNFGQWR